MRENVTQEEGARGLLSNEARPGFSYSITSERYHYVHFTIPRLVSIESAESMGERGDVCGKRMHGI